MGLVWFFSIVLLIAIAVGLGLLRTAARWSRELAELEQHGVETTGTVLRKITYHTRGGGRSRYIRYTYTDQFGKQHSRKTIVLGDAWERYQEGGEIPVVYSQRAPRVSAAKDLYESMGKAPAGKRGKDAGSV